MRKKLLLFLSCLLLTSCGPSPYKQITDAANTAEGNLPSGRAPQGKICEPASFSGIGSKIIDISKQTDCKFYRASCTDGGIFWIYGYDADARNGTGLHNELCRDGGGEWKKIWNKPGKQYEYAEVEIDKNTSWELNIY